MTKPSIWRRMGGVFRPSTLEPNSDARANGERLPRVGLKEAHAGLQPYPPKGTPNPAVGEFLSEGKIPPFPPRTDGKDQPPSESESWVATGEFGVTTEDRRRAAGSL